MILRKICVVRRGEKVLSFYVTKRELLIAVNIWKRYRVDLKVKQKTKTRIIRDKGVEFEVPNFKFGN